MKNPIDDTNRDSPLNWPPMLAVLKAGRHGSLRERVKYRLRMAISAAFQREFLQTVNGDASLRAMFENQSTLFHPPLSAFLDRRFTVARRFSAAITDLTQATRLFGADRLRRFAAGARDVLCEPLPGVRICLGLNEVNEQEGYWAISLRDPQGQRLYNLSFGFLDARTVIIASLQGPSAVDCDAQSLMRELTKSAHGLRPPHLIVEALRAASDCWGIERIEAIDPSHHVKTRWNHRRPRLKFDYRELWTELLGVRRADGHWQLERGGVPKEIDNVPSRKRSMYRKRFLMLDQIGSDLASALWLAAPIAAFSRAESTICEAPATMPLHAKECAIPEVAWRAATTVAIAFAAAASLVAHEARSSALEADGAGQAAHAGATAAASTPDKTVRSGGRTALPGLAEVLAAAE